MPQGHRRAAEIGQQQPRERDRRRTGRSELGTPFSRAHETARARSRERAGRRMRGRRRRVQSLRSAYTVRRVPARQLHGVSGRLGRCPGVHAGTVGAGDEPAASYRTDRARHPPPAAASDALARASQRNVCAACRRRTAPRARKRTGRGDTRGVHRPTSAAGPRRDDRHHPALLGSGPARRLPGRDRHHGPILNVASRRKRRSTIRFVDTRES